jgi:crossover junction endodeoxyribonuclease RuvC
MKGRNNMSWYTVGIDPGQTGALTLLRSDSFPMGFWDWPADNVILADTFRSLQIWDIKLAVIEKAQAWPNQGVVSMFKYGVNFGTWLGMLAFIGWPLQIITPQRWRKSLDSSVPAKPTKEDLIRYTKQRWPMAAGLDRQKDHGRAEALLIAEYARQIILKGENRD